MNKTSTAPSAVLPTEREISLDDTCFDERGINTTGSGPCPTSFDDPVPDGSRTDFFDSPRPAYHDVEGRVMQQLSRDTALEFDALTVRRFEESLLVEGVVRGKDGPPEIEDLSELIRQLSDVPHVENRLLVRDAR